MMLLAPMVCAFFLFEVMESTQASTQRMAFMELT